MYDASGVRQHAGRQAEVRSLLHQIKFGFHLFHFHFCMLHRHSQFSFLFSGPPIFVSDFEVGVSLKHIEAVPSVLVRQHTKIEPWDPCRSLRLEYTLNKGFMESAMWLQKMEKLMSDCLYNYVKWVSKKKIKITKGRGICAGCINSCQIYMLLTIYLETCNSCFIYIFCNRFPLQLLNQIVCEFPPEHPLSSVRPLRDSLGHTPIQVCQLPCWILFQITNLFLLSSFYPSYLTWFCSCINMNLRDSDLVWFSCRFSRVPCWDAL